MTIEELNDLREEIKDLLDAKEFKSFLTKKVIQFLSDINKVSVLVIKGWIFQIYTLTKRVEKYHYIN